MEGTNWWSDKSDVEGGVTSTEGTSEGVVNVIEMHGACSVDCVDGSVV